MGEPLSTAGSIEADGRVKRIVFFGRLEQRKGLGSFAAGLNSIEPGLLEGLELEFLGRATKYFTPDRVSALLLETTKRALRSVSFQTDLDQPEALARLSRPGTLAVMPSLEDNSPNTVYECLERGIPFLASHAGGTSELVAPADQPRVLFEPTPEGVEAALRRALSAGDALRPAHPAFDAATSLERWAEVLATQPREVPRVADRPAVDVVIAQRHSTDALSRCLSALGRQSYADFGVIVALAGSSVVDVMPSEGFHRQPAVVRSERRSVEAAREAGLQAGHAPWVVFLDEEDQPEVELLETLVRA